MIRIPKTKSKKVLEFATIMQDAKAMNRLLCTYVDMGGKGPDQHYAIHHSQISSDPYNFFVVNPKMFGEKESDVMVVVNPEILEKDSSTKKKVREACMSFPLRRGIEVTRYDRIKVRYQVPTPNGKGMKQKEEYVEGFMAQIFQHEVQHAHGQHIYIGSNSH